MSNALCVFIHASETGHAKGVPIVPSRGRSVEVLFDAFGTLIWKHFRSVEVVVGLVRLYRISGRRVSRSLTFHLETKMLWHQTPPPQTVTMSAYQDKVLDFQKYVKCLKFAAYNLCNTSASFTHRFDIVATFPRPETWHWTKWTVIGCLTCRSNGIMGGPWPMKAAICSSRSAISLKAWHLQQQTATSRSLLNAFKSLLQVKTSITIKFIIFKVH